MNNGYYQPIRFPNNANDNMINNTNYEMYTGLPEEDLYIDNVLKLNKGKLLKIHITIPGSIEWQDQIFEGLLEEVSKDHIIISNPSTGQWNIIPMIYLDFIILEEPVNYNKNNS